MAKIVSACAYANNEVAFIAWDVDEVIPGCLGFDVTRVCLAADGTVEERTRCATWVGFKGQSNPHWIPQDTGVWPVQKLSWRDLTLRKRRNGARRRPDEVRVRYEIRPVGDWKPGLERAPDPTPKRVKVAELDNRKNPTRLPDGKVNMIEVDAYEGRPRPLGYLTEAVATNDITITSRRGVFRSTFTNGILAAQ